MTTEAIVCDVPTSTAEKIESITCLVRETHFMEGWDLAGTLLSTVANIALAYLAYRAWTIARETRDEMKSQSKQQWQLVRDQIDAQRDLATKSHENARALQQENMSLLNYQNFCEVLADCITGIAGTEQEFNQKHTAVTLAWNSWAMSLVGENEEIRLITQDYISGFQRASLVAHTAIKPDMTPGQKSVVSLISERMLTYYGAFVGTLNQWMTLPDNRADAMILLRENLVSFNETFREVFLLVDQARNPAG